MARVLTAFFLIAFALSFRARADVVGGAGNWTIEPGSLPHIVYDRNRAINFAIDKYGSSGWRVAVHHTSGLGYVEVGVAGASVNLATFLSDLYEVEGTGDVFRFAFCWRPARETGSTVRLYGWVTLGTSDGDLVVLAAEVADEPDAAIVGRGEPSDGGGSGGETPAEDTGLVFDWVFVDCGDHVELGRQKTPTGTSGKVTIPETLGGKPVVSIGERAFQGMDVITEVSIPETVSNISMMAFANCRSLAVCNIPSGVTNIAEEAFADTALRDVALPDGLGEIKQYAFAWCESLTNATFGAGLSNICMGAFLDTRISSASISPRIDAIGQYAFVNCPNLKEASVWPWTRLDAQAFDSACEIRYTGTVTNFSGFVRDSGEYVTNLMASVGREHFDGVTEFMVYDEYGEMYGNEYWTSKLLFYSGIGPGIVSKRGGVLRAKYTLPEIEMMSFDPAKRTVTGRVVPKGGCRIVAKPLLPWQLGVRRFDDLNGEGVVDWTAVPDVSSYDSADTPGVFMHTISEDDFSTNRFFRLELIDR